MNEKLIDKEDLSKFRNVVVKDSHALIKSRKYLIRIKIPFETNKELAALLGHALGDGHIKKDEQHFHYTNENKDLIDEVELLVKKLFAVEIHEYYRENNQIYDLNFPTNVAKLLVICGFPKGRKTTQIITIPDWIKQGSIEIKVAFLRALFDDEGWIEIEQGGFCIGFGQNKKEWLLEHHKHYMEELRTILTELNIQTSNVFERSKKGGSIQLGFKVIGFENLSAFNAKIGFLSRNKQDRLDFTIKNFKQIQFGKKEAKQKILENLTIPIRSKDLATKLNRDQKTVWKHLHQLNKKNLVIKIGTKNKVFWQINETS